MCVKKQLNDIKEQRVIFHIEKGKMMTRNYMGLYFSVYFILTFETWKMLPFNNKQKFKFLQDNRIFRKKAEHFLIYILYIFI